MRKRNFDLFFLYSIYVLFSPYTILAENIKIKCFYVHTQKPTIELILDFKKVSTEQDIRVNKLINRKCRDNGNRAGQYYYSDGYEIVNENEGDIQSPSKDELAIELSNDVISEVSTFSSIDSCPIKTNETSGDSIDSDILDNNPYNSYRDNLTQTITFLNHKVVTFYYKRV